MGQGFPGGKPTSEDYILYYGRLLEGWVELIADRCEKAKDEAWDPGRRLSYLGGIVPGQGTTNSYVFHGKVSP